MTKYPSFAFWSIGKQCAEAERDNIPLEGGKKCNHRGLTIKRGERRKRKFSTRKPKKQRRQKCKWKAGHQTEASVRHIVLILYAQGWDRQQLWAEKRIREQMTMLYQVCNLVCRAEPRKIAQGAAVAAPGHIPLIAFGNAKFSTGMRGKIAGPSQTTEEGWPDGLLVVMSFNEYKHIRGCAPNVFRNKGGAYSYSQRCMALCIVCLLVKLYQRDVNASRNMHRIASMEANSRPRHMRP